MTHQPDEPPRDPRPDEAARPDPDPADSAPLDEDAAWQEIVAHYGERPAMGPEPRPEPRRNPFDRSFLDSLDAARGDGLNSAASWEDEGHFVPPEPPPLPPVEPRRKLAWAGLFGAPLLLLVAVVFGIAYPTWVTGTLVAAFVGGFVYLVATMPRTRPDDWSGDDGAVV